MRVLIALFMLFILSIASEIKIATYNVENLFDAVEQGTEYRDYKANRWNKAKYHKKLNNIAKVLRSLDADVIGLNEIENSQVLAELAKLSGYRYYEFANTKGAPIGLGILSRYKIKSSSKILVNGVKTRPILKSVIEIDGVDMEFFVAHFPARKNPLKDRKAAAKTMINAVKDSKNGVIIGDLNSNFGYGFLLNELKGWTNLWEFVPKSKQNSYVRSKNSAIDHIILNNSFIDGKEMRYMDFGVYKPSGEYSDHYALYARLSSNPKPVAKKSIDQIKHISQNQAIISGMVVYRDKNGYILADKSRRGIYIYEPDPSLPVGSLVQAAISGVESYKGNLQISNLRYIKVDAAQREIDEYLLDSSLISTATSGDVIGDIELNVQNGYADIDGQRYKIYSPKSKVNDGKIRPKKAVVWIYKGQKELIIE